MKSLELSEGQLEVHFRRLNLAHMRRIYQEVAVRAEKESWSYRDFLALLLAEEVARRKSCFFQPWLCWLASCKGKVPRILTEKKGNSPRRWSSSGRPMNEKTSQQCPACSRLRATLPSSAATPPTPHGAVTIGST